MYMCEGLTEGVKKCVDDIRTLFSPAPSLSSFWILSVHMTTTLRINDEQKQLWQLMRIRFDLMATVFSVSHWISQSVSQSVSQGGHDTRTEGNWTSVEGEKECRNIVFLSLTILRRRRRSSSGVKCSSFLHGNYLISFVVLNRLSALNWSTERHRHADSNMVKHRFW